MCFSDFYRTNSIFKTENRTCAIRAVTLYPFTHVLFSVCRLKSVILQVCQMSEAHLACPRAGCRCHSDNENSRAKL